MKKKKPTKKKTKKKTSEKPVKLKGLTLSCLLCHTISAKQYHCKIPTYWCPNCNNTFQLQSEWVEQDLTNTRQYKNIEEVINKIVN